MLPFLLRAQSVFGDPALNHLPSESPVAADSKARNAAVLNQLVNRSRVDNFLVGRGLALVRRLERSVSRDLTITRYKPIFAHLVTRLDPLADNR
jgi:hypothetical protein